VLGVISFERRKDEEISVEVQALVDTRATARVEKNWAESDRIRDKLAGMGWSVRDSRDGQKVKKCAHSTGSGQASARVLRWVLRRREERSLR
jgi:hypothetical protein